MNIMQYIKDYQNKEFKECPFNEVDALILSLIPFYDYKEKIPAFKKKKIKLKDIDLQPIKIQDIFIRNTYKMVQSIQNTKRYQDIFVYHYMRVVNKEMQFSALTMKLPNKITFVAFAGTDSSIIGWKEDFQLACKYPGISQKYANVYLKRTIKLWDKKIMIGGHSKGGNLAISSAMNANFWIKKRIDAIYNFDGPGFLKEQIDSKEFKSVKTKIKMFVPEESIIGMILYHSPNYIVVKSKSFHILQHDAFNWITEANHFKVSKQNKKSKNLEKKITLKLENLSVDERLNLVEKLFQLFEKNHILDTKEIKLTNAISLIKSFYKLDKETKNLLLEFITLIMFS